MAIKRIFKSHIASTNYLTKKGKTLRFIEGKFMTDIEEEIAELEYEIKSGHPYIYIDAAEKEIDTTLEDKIKEAQREAAMKVLLEHNATIQGAQGEAQPKTMQPAALLNVTSSAVLSGLSKPSNGSPVAPK